MIGCFGCYAALTPLCNRSHLLWSALAALLGDQPPRGGGFWLCLGRPAHSSAWQLSLVRVRIHLRRSPFIHKGHLPVPLFSPLLCATQHSLSTPSTHQPFPIHQDSSYHRAFPSSPSQRRQYFIVLSRLEVSFAPSLPLAVTSYLPACVGSVS